MHWMNGLMVVVVVFGVVAAFTGVMLVMYAAAAEAERGNYWPSAVCVALFALALFFFGASL